MQIATLITLDNTHLISGRYDVMPTQLRGIFYQTKAMKYTTDYREKRRQHTRLAECLFVQQLMQIVILITTDNTRQ